MRHCSQAQTIQHHDDADDRSVAIFLRQWMPLNDVVVDHIEAWISDQGQAEPGLQLEFAEDDFDNSRTQCQLTTSAVAVINPTSRENYGRAFQDPPLEQPAVDSHSHRLW